MLCRIARTQKENTTPTVRLSARISTDLHAMLKHAAALQGRTMTDFVIAAVQDAARRAMDEAGLIGLSQADQEYFARALLDAPPPAFAQSVSYAPFSCPQAELCHAGGAGGAV